MSSSLRYTLFQVVWFGVWWGTFAVVAVVISAQWLPAPHHCQLVHGQIASYEWMTLGDSRVTYRLMVAVVNDNSTTNGTVTTCTVPPQQPATFDSVALAARNVNLTYPMGMSVHVYMCSHDRQACMWDPPPGKLHTLLFVTHTRSHTVSPAKAHVCIAGPQADTQTFVGFTLLGVIWIMVYIYVATRMAVLWETFSTTCAHTNHVERMDT